MLIPGLWVHGGVGVQVPGILVPRDVGAMRCWYLGYQHTGVSVPRVGGTRGFGTQEFRYVGASAALGVGTQGFWSQVVLVPRGVGTRSTEY